MPQQKSRYHVQGLHIIDTESNPPQSIYIRDILDHTSCEFSRCKLSAAQRLEIIADLGLESLTPILRESYINKGVSRPSYTAKHEAALAFLSLRLSAGEIDCAEYSRLFKAQIVPLLLSPAPEE